MSELAALSAHPVARLLSLVLLHFLWQGLAVLLITATALLALRRSTPRARYGVLLGIFLFMAALPSLTFVRLGRTPLPPPVIAQHRVARAPVFRTAAPAMRPVTWLGTVTLPRPRPNWLPLAWAAGVCLLSLRLLYGWVGLHLLRRRGRPLSGEDWEARLRRLTARLRVTRRVELLVSSRLRAPTLIGWLRPAILLPASALSGLTPDQLEMILAHELAHLRRADYLVNLLQTLVETLLFYHPAVWWVSRRIREEREMCCDAEAVKICGDAVRYSRALLALEERRQQFSLAANGGPLKRRVERLLVAEKRAGSLGIAAVGILALLCCGAAVSVAHAVAPAPPQVSNRGAAARTSVVLLMNREEQDEYSRLPDDAARDAFIERFWAGRTPDERAEHERRVGFAERFRTGAKPGWDTGRGRVYVQQGPPDQIETHPSDNAYAQSEIWRYASSGREYRFQGPDYELMTMSEKSANGRGKVGSRRAIPAGARRPVIFIMSREQQDEYVLLPDDAARDAFIERFWASRTPAERAEHEVRVRYATERFADPSGPRPGWDTARGRTYVKDGPPDEIESHPADHFEVWRYNDPKRTYTFSGERYDVVNIQFAGNGGMIVSGTVRRAGAGDVAAEVTVDVRPGVVIGANPPYPPLARSARVQGDVVLRGTAGPDGKVKTVTAVSGHPLLTLPAMEAAKAWTIEAGGAESQFEATVHFALRPPKP